MFIRTEKSLKEFMNYYPIVSAIVIINLVLWLVTDLLHLSIGIQIFQWGIGHNLSVLYGEYWRLITPVFLHGGLMHVLFNSFALVLFGPALEQMIGRFKFVSFYLLAGLAGNIGTYVIDPTSNIPHLGASGAVYGLFGIYVFMVVFRKHLIDQANAQIVLTIFIIGLVMTFIRPGINIYAHIFGFIGGFALGPLLLVNAQPFSISRNYKKRRSDSISFDPNRWEKRRAVKKLQKNILWIILGVLVFIGIISQLF
ncbi:rhomboid family intramembrane serine protease [Virgibacillus sp. W0181]|uniref:rhomboid family intramembrane serine protease n=1 Tax=Virgibacillus sp. W0181 TaxID=3391581 RepID=UPI003F481EF8